MSFMEGQGSEGAVDERLQAFIEAEAKRQEFQNLVYNLTDICWEICVDSPSTHLGTNAKKCLVNCVERFIDTTNFITNRLERVISNTNQELDIQN